MPALIDLLRTGRPAAPHAPWPRAVVAAEAWGEAAARIAAGEWALVALWAEPAEVHMAVFDRQRAEYGIVSLDCPDGGFPSVGRLVPAAIRPERAIRDLVGLEPVGAPDIRPWIDHGKWGLRHPLGEAVPVDTAPAAYEFLPAEGPGLHQVAVGPVHAGIIEPGHFRFTVSGETLVRVEERLGYTHKGTQALMMGASLDRAALLAGRASGDSTVAYAYAFCRAAEAALGLDVPPRARHLRALMAELERLANHVGDIGAICNDASFALMHAHTGVLRERVLRTVDACFGHRLMRDRIVPGGVAVDLGTAGLAALHALLEELRRRLPAIVELYDRTTSLQDRTVGAGALPPALSRQFGAGGYVGRASGQDVDARRLPGYPPYDRLRFEVPVLREGDVNARVWIRIREVEQSLSLVEQILEQLPAGDIRVPVTASGEPREGLALIEGFRGDIFVWLRLAADGSVERCHLRDPSWFQWPLLEIAAEGNIIADFPLCNKSFNCAYSGHDL